MRTIAIILVACIGCTMLHDTLCHGADTILPEERCSEDPHGDGVPGHDAHCPHPSAPSRGGDHHDDCAHDHELVLVFAKKVPNRLLQLSLRRPCTLDCHPSVSLPCVASGPSFRTADRFSVPCLPLYLKTSVLRL